MVLKRFQLYLYGRKFTLVTDDHQPLTRIFGPKSSIPSLTAARLQRWAVLLSGYDFHIVCVCASITDELPITAAEIGEGTKKDSLLTNVYEYTSSGWPGSCPSPELKLFGFAEMNWLWKMDVFYGADGSSYRSHSKEACWKSYMRVRMKALARFFVWWPGIDLDLEGKVSVCNVCSKAHQVPVLLWPWSTEPWQRIHVDYAEVRGQQFLLVVDSHSKWMEIFSMNSTTANATIESLRALFATYGLPQELVSDNGPQFVAGEFKTFLELMCIKHTLCPPYHPSTNGLAERHVQTFKHIYQSCPDKGAVQHKVADILFRYRNTPHTIMDKTSAQLFLKREPRTHLSLVNPSLQRYVEKKQF